MFATVKISAIAGKPMNSAREQDFVVQCTIRLCSAAINDGIPQFLSQRSCPIHGRVNFRYRIVLRTGKKSA
jgi:hypothetical protein